MPDISLSADVDTSKVAAGMASIENAVKQASASVASHLTALFGAGAIIANINRLTEAAETIHREAARFGIDAEQLQLVTNAAKPLGLEIGQVARAMNLLEINAQKAIDPATKQALAMEHLGISAQHFSQLDMQGKFLALADAYKNSAQDGQAYSDVAELIGKRNTELIPLLAQGAAGIERQGKAFRIMSTEEIETLHALKVEEEKYLASLDGILAQAIVGWGRLFATIKKEAEAFANWASRNGSIFSPSSWQAGPFGVPYFVGNSGGGSVAAGVSPAPTTPSAKDLMIHPPGTGTGGAPVGITDLSAGSGGGGGGGGGSGSTAEWLSGLNVAEKINTLLKERVTIQAKLDSADEQGDEHAASRFQLEQQLEKIDKTLLPLRQQLTIEEQKGVAAADQQIEKSQDRIALENLLEQATQARFNGQELIARDLDNEAQLLKITLDYNEKIQAAIDKANDARARGLEQTAQENELLAQQLETEKQQAIADQKKAQERQRIRDSYGPNPLTINALAQGNLRLGATSDVYAAALAASRGIQPGTPEYDRLVQQISAEDQLRMLQGKNLTSADILQRNKLVDWFAKQQQQQASASADQSHRDEIAFWENVASGHSEWNKNSPYTNVFGTSPFTSANTIPGQGDSAAAISKLSAQIDLQQQQLNALQQIQKNTEIVHV